MRADWDDRPSRRRGAEDRGARLIRWCFWAGAALVLLCVSRPDLVAALQERFFAGTEAPRPAVSAPAVVVEQSPVEPLIEYHDTITEADLAAARAIALGQTGATSGGRQTSFSDDNYVPRQDVNVMESRHVREYAQVQTQRVEQPRSRGLNGTGTATFTWEDARQRLSRWQTSYTYRNSLIDTASFCSNYRRGSIEYRTCRKGAKQWLGERCGSGNRVGDERQRMYCHAHSGFRL